MQKGFLKTASDKQRERRYLTMKKLCAKNLNAAYLQNTLLSLGSFFVSLALAVGWGVLVFRLFNGTNGVAWIMLCPVFLIAIFIPCTRVSAWRRECAMDLEGILLEIESAPVVFFDNACFAALTRAQKREIVKELIASGKLFDAELVGDYLVAKQWLKLTEGEAERYYEQHKSGSAARKTVVIELPDTERDAQCDNCGYAFGPGESYCSRCGTMRKDLRRRV